MEENGALDPTANVPLAAVDVLNSTMNTRVHTHVLRHMPVPRDTSVLRQIIIVCESVGKGPNSVQRRTFATCEKYHISSDVHGFLPILSRSDVRPPRVLCIVFMFINRQLFISRDIQSCDCIFGFLRKE